ncbi:hypothetical protein AB7813_08335 [Tardiphaga sp. 20_F10_N6_6]|uniref:hypothetical protein n=1 Tax=Tardiphaga sp. 20_F10_N6_6 TaxID=3240788 RepID=UPI003F88FCC9
MWQTLGTIAMGLSVIAAWVLGAYIALCVLVGWAIDVTQTIRMRLVGRQLVKDAMAAYRAQHPDKFNSKTWFWD